MTRNGLQPQQSVMRKDILTITVLGALLCGMTVLASSQHRSWHDKYTSASGTRCCDKDCMRAVGRLIDQTEAGTTLEVNGVLVRLPTKSVHQSEDGEFWVCVISAGDPARPLTGKQIRCAFLATGL